MLSDRVAVTPDASRTLAVKLELPALVGVPVMAPSELSDSPAGKLPDAMLHAYGAVPPAAESVCE
jgi:hypothetical protein